MKKSLLALAFASAIFLAAGNGARGDSVILKSGDFLTGTITRIGPETVDLTTTFAGEIHIKRDTVRTLRSDGKVTIIAADGTTHSAFLTPVKEGTGWNEEVAAAPPIPMPVIALTPPAAAAAPAKVYDLDLERYFLPVGPHWKDEFTLGIVNTTGNSDSTSFASELDLNYKEAPQELNVKVGGAYAVTDGQHSAEQFYFDAVYRRTLPEWDKSERWYVFGENHELYDGIKELSLRSTTSGGLGYYVFKGDRFTLDLRAGPAFVYERFFDGDSDTDGSGLAGLRAQYVVNDHVSISEEALYTVAVADSSRYQLTSDAALNIKLPEVARGMGLKFGFRDDYDNATQPPGKHNDTRLTLSLTFDF